MGNKIEMRGSVVPCSGACGHVFEGSRKENYPHVSKMCYPRGIRATDRAHLR